LSKGGAVRSDYDELLRVVASLAAARDLASLRTHCVEVLAELVPCHRSGWNEVDTERGRIEAVTMPDRYSGELSAAFVAHMDEHPILSHYYATRDGRPYAISDFLDADEFHATGLYRHFYRELGTEDQLAFIFPEPRFVIGVSLSRSTRGFTPHEREMLNALRPHLMQAYRNAQDFSRLRRSLAAMEAVVEEQEEGLVLLNGLGGVDQVTPRAQWVLERWFGTAAPGGLPAIVHDWLTAPAPTGPVLPLIVDRGHDHLIVRRVPVPDGEALLVSESSDDRTEDLLRQLGLTRREAQVLVALTEGHAVGSVGQRLGISPRTVEKHVQHVYDKLGLDNRVSATNLVRQLERDPP
jgi:DNA-binding CsgD family transcriptional regulator